MSDLTDFVLARIEDEQDLAREAAGWNKAGDVRSSGRWHRVYYGGVDDEDDRPVVHSEGQPSREQADHIACHDPARVLAECEARRRIVEEFTRNRERIDANSAEHTMASARGDLTALPTLRAAGWDLGGRDWALEMALRLLALPYADHPDYREDWAS